MIKGDQRKANQDFVQDLRGSVGDVRFDRMTRLLYSTDASIYQIMPIGVAFPRDIEEIAAAVNTARSHRVPILPRGGGSSLAGQAIGQALILDLSRHMDSVLEIDPERRIVCTEPGITLGQLNKKLKPYALMYGPDPASGDRATMGGILGNNSTGAHSIVYGMSSDHVLSVNVVLADGQCARFRAYDDAQWQRRRTRPGLKGEIYRKIPSILARYAQPIAQGYPKTFRQVAGYNLNQISDGLGKKDLARLIVGSEGTLGVITRMTLNLVPIPKVKRLAMVHFQELRAALEAVPWILESGPSTIEVIDKMLLDLTRDRVEYRRLLTFVEGDPATILMVEYAGDTEKELDAAMARLSLKLKQIHHKGPLVVVSDPREQANVWYVRKAGLGILMSIRGDAKPIPFIEDAAVPVDHLADYVTQIRGYAEEVGVEGVALYAHASAGCIHVRPLVNLKTEQGVKQLRQIAEKSVDLVVQYGGTTSGEHGEGLARGEFSERLFGRELAQAFREVKDVFDPQGMMNPGKVVDVPRMDDENLLRFGTGYRTPYSPKETMFSFEKDGGFARAVEMCNGAGVCRQQDEGVMCPSFQAAREEIQSTRGRANALRAAMMGVLGPEGLTSEQLFAVMDLCLSCKACQAECPSAVDMAKLKAEFLHQYYAEHSIPLRTQLFGNIAKLNKLGQPVASLANAFLAGPGVGILKKMGVAPERSMPKFAEEPFSQWVRRRGASKKDASNGARQVVFFHDTFMEHNHPNVGKAAWRVLKAAGYDPLILKGKECCGRPALSKGLLDQAAQLARHNIALLAPYALKGIPIVGCEPSCITMLVDEYPALVPTADAKAVAKMAKPIDIFLEEEIAAGRTRLSLEARARKIVFHGHCHQKAIFGIEGSLALLRRIPNCDVEVIEAGCCGMAGSFGYEQEHYDLSIQLAEMALAPAVRDAPREAWICATGTSCRDQIKHTTGREALHPIEVLGQAIAGV